MLYVYAYAIAVRPSPPRTVAGHFMMAAGHGLEADPEFVSTLAYVVEKYAKRLATDLPAFAKHGKRSVAGAEDVLLVARDNPDLLRRLTEFVDFHDHRGKPAARKKKKDDRDPADDMPGLR